MLFVFRTKLLHKSDVQASAVQPTATINGKNKRLKIITKSVKDDLTAESQVTSN